MQGIDNLIIEKALHVGDIDSYVSVNISKMLKSENRNKKP